MRGIGIVAVLLGVVVAAAHNTSADIVAGVFIVALGGVMVLLPIHRH